MKKDIIAIDLQAARRKAGLRQVDCAHLLGVDKSRISRIESGQLQPTVREVAALSLVYGKQMEGLLAGLLDELVKSLAKQLRRIPTAPDNQPATFNRAHTLSQLAVRLEVITRQENGGA